MFTVKKLKISGFKSFAHPTEILIEDGVTGIIGPNGCGKSNVFEAIRWVMGETSSKSLRSGSMDDVIFNGTQSLPAKNITNCTFGGPNNAEVFITSATKGMSKKELKEFRYSGHLFSVKTNTNGINQKKFILS